MIYSFFGKNNLLISENNFHFLDYAQANTDRGLTFNLSLNIDIQQLDLQASTFASNASSLGYINFGKTLRVRDEDIEDVLYNMFVYSRIKGLFNAFYFNSFSTESNLGVCFRGDAALFELLKTSRNSFISEENFFIEYNIDFGTDTDRRFLALRLIQYFPFLIKTFASINEPDFGTLPFIDNELERYLCRLREDYYSRDHIITKQGNDSQDYVRSNTKKNSDRYTSNLDYSKGKIAIVDLESRDFKQIRSMSSCPMLNSFLCDGKLYFLTVGKGHSIENNCSFIFSRTNFITLSKDNNDMEQINRYYDIVDNSNVNHLTASEVFNVTGLKCLNIRNGGKRRGNGDIIPKLIPPVSKIISKFGKELDLDKLLLKIVDSLNEDLEIDIEDMVRGLGK